VLELSDAYLIIAGITVFLMAWVTLLPQRTYPPRLMFLKKKT